MQDDSDPSLFAQSNFTRDTEGWTVQFGYPVAVGAAVPDWQQSAPGFLTGVVHYQTETENPRNNGFLVAPAKFLGNLSNCYGQLFAYQIAFELPLGSSPKSFYEGSQGVILAGSADALLFHAPVTNLYGQPLPPEPAVQSISIRLDTSSPCTILSTGRAPSEAQMRAVLRNVTALLVRMDFYPEFGLWKTAVGGIQLYQQSSGEALDPKLVDLQQRLEAARQNSGDGSLPIDDHTLGTDGVAIVALMLTNLGVDNFTYGADGLTITPDVQSDTLVVSGTPEETLLGFASPEITAVFSVYENLLTVAMTITTDGNWTISDTFPNIAQNWFSSLTFSEDDDKLPFFVLSSTDEDAFPAGLSLNAYLELANWPASALITLIRGVPQPAQIAGPIQSSAGIESLALQVNVPDFDLPIPIWPTLAFSNPAFLVLGEDNEATTVPYQDLALRVQADVSLEGVSLPLAVQLPSPITGWRLMTIPGRNTSIADVVQFLGALAGLNLSTLLPTALRTLQYFELRQFIVALNASRNDFQFVTFVLGTATGQQGSWTVVPQVLVLNDIEFGMTTQKYSSTDMISGGYVTGTVTIVETLQLTARIPLPLGSGNWTFSANSNGQPVPSLLDFARFLGGDNLADRLPAQLGTLTSFLLNDFTVAYDPTTQTLAQVRLSIANASQWILIPGWFSVTQVELALNIAQPLAGNAKPTGSIAGIIELGDSVAIRITVGRDAPNDDWRLNIFTESVILPNLGDMAKLVGNADVAAMLPQTLVDNHFTLHSMVFAANISQQKIEKFSFGLGCKDTWPLISEVLAITSVDIYLDCDWTSGSLVFSGGIFGNVTFLQADFSVEASGSSEGWNLGIVLMEGSALTLENAVNAFISNSWQTLADLGVPQISLTAASMIYATATSDYTLEAHVTFSDPISNKPWIVPVGITSITIRDLGVKVATKYSSNGTKDGTSVELSGAFDIGSVRFQIIYQVGGDLVIDCSLVGSNPVSILDMVRNLCNADAANTAWTSGFSALDAIHFTNVSAKIVLGTQPSFQLLGTMTVDGNGNHVAVQALFLVEQIQSRWEFAMAVRINADWTLAGFTNTFSAFNINTQNWMVVASSFSDLNFKFPDSFPTPNVAVLEKGLDFYGVIDIQNTYPTIQGVTTVLPSGTISGTQLTVHGLLTDPLAKSYLEIILSASADGVPLMGWDVVRLAVFSLRLDATPAFALHGDFIIKSINNGNTSDPSQYFHLVIELKVSLTEVKIELLPTVPIKDRAVIFQWTNALGIQSLNVALTDLAIGIIFEGPAFDGTIGGRVTFEHDNLRRNTVMGNMPPDARLVRVHLLSKLREHALLVEPAVWRTRIAEIRHLPLTELIPMAAQVPSRTDYCNVGRIIDPLQLFDQDGILVEMRVAFIIAVEEPVPVPYELSGHFVNFTLPYILKRFADVEIPDILMPIQFPDVCFGVKIKPTSPSDPLNFAFNGYLIVYGIHGHLVASFTETRILFTADMDLIEFTVAGNPIVQIRRSKIDTRNGPQVYIDSKPPGIAPNIKGDFYCNFFNAIDIEGHLYVKAVPSSPLQSCFYFDFQGNVGQLANFHITAVYQNVNYLQVDGGFYFALTESSISGFYLEKNGEQIKVADSLNLSVQPGLTLNASLGIKLDATNPLSPDFSMHVNGGFDLNLGSGCDFHLTLAFNADVNKDSISHLPQTIAQQLSANAASIFRSLFDAAECFVKLLELGLVVLEEGADVALALAKWFGTTLEQGAKFLSDLGNTAKDVADWLWKQFGSEDSEANTKALKDTGKYSDKDVAEAVKDASDNNGVPYTPQKLVKDQAYAGYAASSVAVALVHVFPQYISNAVGAGKLLADQTLTQFNYVQVAAGIHAAFLTPKASDLYAVLKGVYSGRLTAPQMAAALAPLYLAPEVAVVLNTDYPSDTVTALQMANLLLPAYSGAGKALSVGDLAQALGPLYAAKTVAPVLHSNFGAETALPAQMATLLLAVYTGGRTLSAQGMADALAASPYDAASIVPTLKANYSPQTDTAMKMAGLVSTAYPGISLAAMADALVAGQYPAQTIAEALQHYYPDQTKDAEQMAALFAAENYTPQQTAPVLKNLYPGATTTAAQMVALLKGAYGANAITAQGMAQALVAAPYTPQQSAPALKNSYPTNTTTAADMAVLLQFGYGANNITPQAMAQALYASPYDAAGTAGVLRALYPADTANAAQMAGLLAQATYTAADTAPVLKSIYPNETHHASNMAALLANVAYLARTVSPVLKAIYASEVGTAETMLTTLAGAYTNPLLSAPEMAAALAAAPFGAVESAPALHQHYSEQTTTAESMWSMLSGAYTAPPLTAEVAAAALAASSYPVLDTALVLQAHYISDTRTAAQMASLLKNAFVNPALKIADMLAALAATRFSIFEISPVVTPMFAAKAIDLGLALATAYATVAKPRAMQLGIALQASQFSSTDVAAGVLAGVPDTPPAVMAAVLTLAFSDGAGAVLSAVESCKQGGNSAAVAAKKVVQTDSSITGAILTVAVSSVYSPPNLDIATISAAAAGAYVAPDPVSIASGLIVEFPATLPSQFVLALAVAWSQSGKALSETVAANALVTAYRTIGQTLSPLQVAMALIAGFTTRATVTGTAVALKTVFSDMLDPVTMLSVLGQALTGTGILYDPEIAAVALQAAYAFPLTDALPLGQPISQSFQLVRTPGQVAAMSVALNAAGYALEPMVIALGKHIFEDTWNGYCFELATSVYVAPQWPKALQAKNAGKPVQQAGPTIRADLPNLSAKDMVIVLASTYYLTETASAVVPVGEAMKAANYKLDETAAAMGKGQYEYNWNVQFFQQLVRVFM